LQYFDKEKALCEIMKNCRIVNLLCAVCFAIFFAGCTSPYIGKTRQEIVDIIAQDYKASPKDIYIRVSPDSNWVFNHPEEILNDPQRGKTMRQLEQWGILPYKKFWFDGTYCTLLTFKDNVVIKEEADVHCGGYGFFKPFAFVFLLIAPWFL
jgi:hypothetical protein